MKPNFANPLGWMPTYAVQMLTATPSQPDFVPWGLMLTVCRDEKSDCVPIWGVPPATSVQAAILDKFDVAVAREIVKVASLPYNSNEVCRGLPRVSASASPPTTAKFLKSSTSTTPGCATALPRSGDTSGQTAGDEMPDSNHLFWGYCMLTMAWWLRRPISPTQSVGVFGPFTADEARLAGVIHGVPFDPTP